MMRILLSSLIVVIGGCTFMHKDFSNSGKNYDEIPLHMFSLGDDKQLVVEQIGGRA